MAHIPAFAIVKSEITSAPPCRMKTAPENKSWKIKTKGMIVIAAVVVFSIHEIKRDIISEAYVIKKNVIFKRFLQKSKGN